MRFLHLTIIRLSVFFLLGITLGFSLAADLKVVGISGGFVLLMFLLSFFIASKSDVFKVVYWLCSHLLMFTIGFLIATADKIDNQPAHYIHHIDDQLHSIQAEIDQDYKNTDYYRKFVLAIHRVDDQEFHGQALLQIPQKHSIDSLKIGDLVTFNARFQQFKSSKNPQVFDYPKFMENQNIYSYINLQEGRIFKVLPQDKFNLRRWANQLRDDIEQSLIKAGFEKQHVNLIKALILGQKQDLEKSTYQKFAEAGIVHILAVSGLHVGIVLIILQSIFSFFNALKYGRIIKLILIIFFLWSFALMAGFSPSVVRASLMFSLFAVAHDIFKRRTNTINLLAVSMVLILILYPKMVFQVGFQLSYTAVFGIIMLFPNLFKLYRPRFKLDKIIWSVVCVTISAQLAILPLGLYYFHQFPGLFIIANVLVIPFLGIILSAGFIAIGLSLAELMPKFLVQLIGYLLDGLLWVTQWISQYDSFLIKYIYFDKLMLVLASFALFCFLIYQRSFKRILLLLSALSVASLLLYFYQIQPNKFDQKAFIFHQIADSHVGFAKDQQLQLFTSDSTLVEDDYLVRNMQLKYGKKEINIDSLGHFYRLNDDQKLVVVDESGIYKPNWIEDNIVLLRNSPKINFNRLLDHQPKQIIADGSNYTSFVQRWKKSAEKESANLHVTSEAGYWQYQIDQ